MYIEKVITTQNISKNIPGNINKILSSISSNEKVFNKAVTDNQIALDESRYTDKLNYQPNKT